MRKHFFGLAVLLLLLGISAIVSEVHPARTESTTIVVPDDFLTIQEAINNAVERDTIFVKTGIYYEHVIVNKTVALVGEDSGNTIIDGNGTGRVIDIIRNNVNVTGLMVQGGGSVAYPAIDAGISLSSATDCTISENRLVGNGFAGISLLNSQRNTIAGNNVTGSGWGGIHLMGSGNNVVSGNILESNIHVGVNGHASSHRNTIEENVISNSTYGMFYHNANYNNILRNSISDIAVEGIWLQDQVSYNIVAENSLINCSVGIKLLGPNTSNIISGNFLTNGQSGIQIQNAGYTEIYNNTIAHNYGGEWDAGIRLDSAGYSKIHANLIVDNWRGILLYTSSPGVSIYNNNITSNDYAVRVASGGSDHLNVSSNIVMNNRGYGIGLTGFGGASNYATLSRNLIVNNSDGITLGQYSNYNNIVYNNISQNGYGFYVENSTQNTICGNNILDNDQQVYVSTDSVNNWDSGYPLGGNYWSDYLGVDMYSGPHQNETGTDGIGDTPYEIQTDNQDRYPFTTLLGWDTTPPSIDAVSRNPPIPDNFESVTVTVNVTDMERGVYNVTLSYSTDSGETWHNVVMEKTTADSYQTEIPELPAGTHVQYKIIAYDRAGNPAVEDNAGEYYVYTVISEFPTAIILPLFVFLTLVAVARAKTRWKVKTT